MHKQRQVSCLFSHSPSHPLSLFVRLKTWKSHQSCSFLGKDTLHEACGNLLIPDSLTMVVLPSFIHQCFLGISDGFSWSIFKHSCYQWSQCIDHKNSCIRLIWWEGVGWHEAFSFTKTHSRQTLPSLCWTLFRRLMNLVVCISGSECLWDISL